MIISEKLKDFISEEFKTPRTWTDEELWKSKVAHAMSLDEGEIGFLSPEKYTELTGDDNMTTSTSPDPEKVFSQSNIRVKSESEKYSTTKSVGTHVKTGLEVHNPFTRRNAEYPSEFENAKMGSILN